MQQQRPYIFENIRNNNEYSMKISAQLKTNGFPLFLEQTLCACASHEGEIWKCYINSIHIKIKVIQ